MSPAAANFESQEQNSYPVSNCQGEIPHETTDYSGTLNDGFNCSKFASGFSSVRSRRKLKKVKKQVLGSSLQINGSAKTSPFYSSFPVSIDSSTINDDTNDDLIASFDCDNNSSSAVNTSSSSGSGLKSNLGKSFENVGFADGAKSSSGSELKSNSVKSFDNVGFADGAKSSSGSEIKSNSGKSFDNVGFADGAKSSKSNLSKCVENVGFADGAHGSVLGAKSRLGGSVAGLSGGAEFGKFDNIGFVFGASNICLSTNLDSKKLQDKNGNMEKVGANFVKNCSGRGKREASRVSADEFGEFNNGSCVYGGNKSDSVLNLKAENEVFGGIGDESGLSNVDFVFGASKGDTVLNLNEENREFGDSAGESGFGNLGCEFVALNSEVRGCGGSAERMGVESKKFNKLGFSFAFDMCKSSPSLNLNTSAPNERVETVTDERAKAEDNGRFEFRKFSNLDFMFSASHKDSSSHAILSNKEADVSAVESANVRHTEHLNTDASFGFTEQSDSAENWEKLDDIHFVFGANPHDSTLSTSMKKKNSRKCLKNMDFIEGKRSLDAEANFQGGKVTGVSGLGNCSDESSGLSGSRKPSNGMNNFSFNSEVDINSGCNLKGNFSFVFESKSNSSTDFDHRPVYNISDELQALNIHDYGKVNAADSNKDYNSNPSGNTSNVYVFGSKTNTTSSTGSSYPTSWDERKGQKSNGIKVGYAFGNNGNTDEVKKTEGGSKVHCLGNNENSGGMVGVDVLNGELKSHGAFRKENRPINLNENSSDGGQIPENQSKSDTELNNDPFPSSSSQTGSSFLPEVSVFEEPPIDRVKMTNSFTSTPVGYGASFTGFSTPNFNTARSFTATVLPDLNKSMEFSFNCSAGDKSFRKTRVKWRHQILARQQAARTNSSKEGESQQHQESPGCCSPMDFSPYQDSNCELSSTVPNKEKDEESCDVISQGFVPSTFTNSVEGEFTFCATSFAQGEASTTKPRHRKKYKMKIGGGINSTTKSQKVNKLRAQGTRGNISNTDAKHSRQERPEAAGTQEACQKWRIRGNQAYKDGDLLKAETCYTKGIDSIPLNKTSGLYIESVVSCYSNRAATRMSLGRVREALADCRMAAELDPTFIKVHLRAANCHLLLGEIEDAIYNYNKCLETGNMVCLDRRFTIEAADGLQKAQKVINCTNQSAELLLLRTFASAAEALGVLAEALVISCYSEKLLEMKAEALFSLQKYEEVVQLCEQTHDFAEKNFTAVGVANPMTNVDGIDSRNSLNLWRWDLLSRSSFRLGRLERAVDLTEKLAQLRSTEDKHGSRSNESSSSLAVTVRELLHCKNAGNEAFQSGRHTEAIEHYTTAISRSVESRPFAAVCICNRAAAHQALGELIDAISDCSLAIALDGSYSKALSRRATLHEMIRDYSEAANDIRRLISALEKQSHEKSQQSGTPDRSTGCSVKDLRRAQRRLSAIEAKAKKGTPLDLYLILGLKASDASSEVKKAYRKAALRHHPDKAGQFLIRSDSGDDEQLWKDILETIHVDADRLFKMIGEANAVLSDSTKRSKYDLEEEMRREDQENSVSSSYGRPSNSYSSPFESSNRRSQESRKSYGNSRYWKEWRTYGNSYSQW